MNYNHLYHAGNFADVMKHSILIALITHFQKKNKPMTIIDTHAGAGDYDLHTREANIHCEFSKGILPVMRHTAVHPALQHLQRMVREVNTASTIRMYPGSALMAATLLRPGDRLIAIEKHPLFFQSLQTQLRGYAGVALHQRDAYEALGALLPPTPRRGLVLIDSPYEHKLEYEILVEALAVAIKRWPEATYMIWYPIKATSNLTFFYHSIEKYVAERKIKTEMTIFPQDTPGLIGSGVMILHPPWEFSSVLTPLMKELEHVLITHQTQTLC